MEKVKPTEKKKGLFKQIREKINPPIEDAEQTDIVETKQLKEGEQPSKQEIDEELQPIMFGQESAQFYNILVEILHEIRLTNVLLQKKIKEVEEDGTNE